MKAHAEHAEPAGSVGQVGQVGHAGARDAEPAQLVVIADDDARVRALCAQTLEPHYRVLAAENGKEALRLLFQHKPDLLLLDVTMPVLDGWEACRRARDLTDTPVIMLTARGEAAEVARGLDGGADDYVVKPFRPTELLARIKAVLRRAQPPRDETPVQWSFDSGNLVVDALKRAVIVRGHEIALSAKEYRLLELLVRHAGEVLSSDQILEEVWGPQFVGETGYVKTFVGLLRKKIEEYPSRPRYIIARRGLGYYFERLP
ncbi:MAG: response regulator transcription factor [Chloroflexi bacterium]|nr:response regulator transcription factor [Chloroflexota bacterium]